MEQLCTRKTGTTTIEGQLEIDHNRGVIYFHNKEGYTSLRICQLPIPIPRPNRRVRLGGHKDPYQLDITHLHHTSWEGREVR